MTIHMKPTCWQLGSSGPPPSVALVFAGSDTDSGFIVEDLGECLEYWR